MNRRGSGARLVTEMTSAAALAEILPNGPAQPVAAWLKPGAPPPVALLFSSPTANRTSERPPAEHSDLQRLLAEARAQAESEAWSAIHTRVDESMARYARALADLQDSLRRITAMADSSQMIADLAVAIASELVVHELTVDPGIVVRVLDEAMASMDGVPAVAVRVCVADAALLRKARPDLPGQPILLEDDSLRPGDIIVEAAEVLADATMHARLESVRAALRRAFSAPVGRAGDAPTETRSTPGAKDGSKGDPHA